MADIAFTWGSYYSTGFIDIDAEPPLLPLTAAIVFPPISGQSDVDTYVNDGNLQAFITNAENAALDHHETPEIPFAACQITDLVGGAFGPLVDAAWSLNGGLLIATRVTCEGRHHVFGVPTTFVYHIYVLHDQLPLLIGFAILAAIVFVAMCEPCAQRLTTFVKQAGPAGAIGGATSALLLFGVAGAVFAIAVYMSERKIAPPGTQVSLPAPPGIPSITTPAVSTSLGGGAGPVRGTVGVSTGGGGGGRAPSRRTRGR